MFRFSHGSLGPNLGPQTSSELVFKKLLFDTPENKHILSPGIQLYLGGEMLDFTAMVLDFTIFQYIGLH